MKVAITGITGFIGTHLRNYLSTKSDIEIIGISRKEFDDFEALKNNLQDCGVVVHLAAVNRHEDASELLQTNISLIQLLVKACIETNSCPFVIFSSSSQMSQNNAYGKSKLKGQEILEEWSLEFKGKYASLVIPNVFGPFGKPFHNSVVATFCHQISRGENPTIRDDREIQLIYVNELVLKIYELITRPQYGLIKVNHQFQVKISALLKLLKEMEQDYFQRYTLPSIALPFELSLFNTFRCYMPNDKFPIVYNKHEDLRGSFIEVMRNNSGGQFSYSTTKPGITRGNHFHTRKVERFAVIQGEAIIRLRRIDKKEVIEYALNGEKPSFVDMPVWHTHNITNVGDKELITLFWINEHYNPDNPDTFFIEV